MGVRSEFAKAQLCLPIPERVNPRGHLSLHLLVAPKNPQRPSVSRELLNIEESKTVPCENLLDGKERKIRKVFVIDRVELVLLDELQQMRKLHGENAIGF